MSAKFKSTAVAAVMMAGLLASGAASAAIAVGGGATLPELLYDAMLPSGIGQTNFSYTGTGSGAGKTAFLTNSATAFKNESVAGTPFWGASQSVHFAGSDSALTLTERDNYNTAHAAAWGPMIQIPAVATSVLIPYKRVGTTALNLSDAQMCAIFSKQPGGRTWGEVLSTSDTTPVQVVYRTDGSGSTELLSNYLKLACPTSGFVVSNSFATMVAGALPSGSPLPPVTTPSPDWLPVTGSGGVSGAFGTDGRVGYLSPEVGYTGSDNSVVARINGQLPLASSIRDALAKRSLPVTVATASNPLNWVLSYQMPAAGSAYPIFGTTNLLLNQCYRDTAVQNNVIALVQGLTGTTYDALIAAHNFVVIPNGTSPTGSPNVPPADNQNWKTQIADVFLGTTSSLRIGNPNICNTRGRPLTN